MFRPLSSLYVPSSPQLFAEKIPGGPQMFSVITNLSRVMRHVNGIYPNDSIGVIVAMVRCFGAVTRR